MSPASSVPTTVHPPTPQAHPSIDHSNHVRLEPHQTQVSDKTRQLWAAVFCQSLPSYPVHVCRAIAARRAKGLDCSAFSASSAAPLTFGMRLVMLLCAI